jgi:CheY-like chemotaxis protein
LQIAPDRERAAQSDLGGTETILVIDDEESVRKTVTAMLEQAGYSVLTAAGGSEGLELFQAHPDRIELVLLDLSMPGMSGRQVLEKLRAIAPESRVAYFTGRELSEEERGEVRIVIEKPVTRHDLLSAVQASLKS